MQNAPWQMVLTALNMGLPYEMTQTDNTTAIALLLMPEGASQERKIAMTSRMRTMNRDIISGGCKITC